MIHLQDGMQPLDSDHGSVEMAGYLHEPAPGRRWLVARQHTVWRPPTDVYETDSHVVVKVEIPGMEQDQFAIAYNTRTLIIAGTRHDPAAKLAYQQMEILYGQFETEVYLPWSIDEEQIEATYENGFLIVLLPKVLPRRIPVGGAGEHPM